MSLRSAPWCLEDTEPAARLRLRIQKNQNQDPGDTYAGFLAPARPDAMSWQAPLTDMVVDRGQRLTEMAHRPRENHHHVPRNAQQVVTPRLNGAAAGWFQQVLAGLAPTGEGLAAAVGDAPDLQASAFGVPGDRWENADPELAFLLGALRVALARATAMPLPEGRVMLPLGGGIVAEVHARACSDGWEATCGKPRSTGDP